MNMYLQGHFASILTFGIRAAQSCQKSQNFTIFAFFAIFDQLWIFVLCVTFWYSTFYIAHATISSLGNNNWAPCTHWSLRVGVYCSSDFDIFKNGLWKKYKLKVRLSRGRKKIINFWSRYSESSIDSLCSFFRQIWAKTLPCGWKMALK